MPDRDVAWNDGHPDPGAFGGNPYTPAERELGYGTDRDPRFARGKDKVSQGGSTAIVTQEEYDALAADFNLCSELRRRTAAERDRYREALEKIAALDGEPLFENECQDIAKEALRVNT